MKHFTFRRPLQTMKRPEVKIGFVAFELLEGLHVTIGRRYDATDHELSEMQDYVENLLRPQLPFTMHFGNFCHMGENNTIPAYRVYFEDPFNSIKDFYHRFYKEAEGKALYPRPKFHITVDTPEKRRTLEALIRIDSTMELTQVSLKTRVEGGEIDVDDKAWKCPTCGNFNPLQQKECLSRGCDQWRPMEVKDAANRNEGVPGRPGDWPCCGYNNFAARDTCAKCNRPKNNPVASVQDLYALPPPSAPAASAIQAQPPVMQPEPPKVESYYVGGARGDWMCVRCNFKIFGSKDRCKCGTRKP